MLGHIRGRGLIFLIALDGLFFRAVSRALLKPREFQRLIDRVNINGRFFGKRGQGFCLHLPAFRRRGLGAFQNRLLMSLLGLGTVQSFFRLFRTTARARPTIDLTLFFHGRKRCFLSRCGLGECLIGVFRCLAKLLAALFVAFTTAFGSLCPFFATGAGALTASGIALATCGGSNLFFFILAESEKAQNLIHETYRSRFFFQGLLVLGRHILRQNILNHRNLFGAVGLIFGLSYRIRIIRNGRQFLSALVACNVVV